MQRFRLAALASFAVVAVAPAAFAADMPAKAPVYKAPPVATYNWTGFYLGGYYGTVTGQAKAKTTATGFPLGVHDHNATALMGGVTAGYNWQFDPHWLIGVEGELGYLGIDRTDVDWDDLTFAGVKTSWYGTARGRLGYVTGPSLLYVTGGAAFVNIEDTFGGQSSQTGAAFIAPTSTTSTRTGWTLGGGIETKLSQNWSAKSEYLYIDAGSVSFLSNTFGLANVATTFDHKFHVFKSGLNYKFGGPNEGLPFFGAPLLPSNHNWAGFYAGVNAGIGISNVRTIGGEGAVPFNTEQDVNSSGFSGGGQLGYNYMLTPRYFVGVEGDVGYLGVRGGDPGFNDPGRIFSDRTSWYGTARVRAGASTGPALLYITGGGAWVRLTDSITNLPVVNETSKTAGGWTFGGGTEVALDARWSARVEALYMDVGRTRLDINAINTEFKDRFTVVRVGLNAKLGD